jgi:cytochrome b561
MTYAPQATDPSAAHVRHWPAVTVGLHWLAATLIVAGFGLGLSMVDLPFSPTRLKWFSWHKWIGITVSTLVLLRLLARVLWPAPAPLPMPRWQTWAARCVHVLLYLLMLVLPLSGWLYSSAKGVTTVYLGLLPLPDLVGKDEALAATLKTGHYWLAMTLAAAVAAHVCAAFVHHWIDGDDTLRRMLPGRVRARDRADGLPLEAS